MTRSRKNRLRGMFVAERSRGDGASSAVALALAACTVVAGAGMRRLFTDNRATVPVIVIALVAHASAWLGRRLRLRLIWAVLGSVLISLIVASRAVFGSTTSHGLPTRATPMAAAQALRDAARQFYDARPPVKAIPGFVVAAMLAVWLAAWLADTAAVRLRLVAEALVPSAAMVVFTGAMAPSRGRAWQLAAYAGSAAAVALLANRRSRSNASEWFASRTPKRPVGTMAGLGVAALAAVAALIVPAVPGVSEEGLIRWRENETHDKPARVTVSPLVSVRSRLVNQSDKELFSVNAAVPAYWRLTSLDRFDGAQWSGNGRYRKTGTKLPGTAGPGTRVLQEFTIAGLSSDWLPTAYRPRSVEGLSKTDRPTFDPSTGSLLASKATGAGYRYRVNSVIPTLATAALAEAGTATGSTELPEGFSPRVTARAREITAGLVTTFEKARALQDFFRRDYVYDTSVPPPSGPTSVEEFVFDTRRGYCEQFSSAFAAMARSLGIPTRIAVGFTPGVLQDGVFHVAGRNAHAWPEVLLAGIGWVAFEPTPGRSIPGAEGYTGVAYVPEAASQSVPTTTTTPSEVQPPTTLPQPAPTTTISITVPARDRSGPWLVVIVVAFAGLVALSVLVLLGVTAARAIHRRRRRLLAPAESEWERTLDELSWLGVTSRPDESSPTFASRAAEHLGTEDADALQALATDVDRTRFAPPTVAAGTTPSERIDGELARRIRRQTRRLPVATRTKRAFDPRLRSRR